MTIAEERAAVIAEARTWLKTPWHHGACVKGAGVDCGRLLQAVFVSCGLIPDEAIDPYPKDFHLHSDREMFLGYVERYFGRVEGASLPGDVGLWKWGRVISHGGIVIAWPVIVHAYYPVGQVVLDDVEANADLAARFQGIWRLRRWM